MEIATYEYGVTHIDRVKEVGRLCDNAPKFAVGEFEHTRVLGHDNTIDDRHGAAVGMLDGLSEGITVGVMVGVMVGPMVGAVGDAVGLVGAAVGFKGGLKDPCTRIGISTKYRRKTMVSTM